MHNSLLTEVRGHREKSFRAKATPCPIPVYCSEKQFLSTAKLWLNNKTENTESNFKSLLEYFKFYILIYIRC